MKTHFRNWLNAVHGEITKLRTTFVVWLSILYPFGSVFLVTVFWISGRSNKVIHTDQFISNLGDVASFFLPFYIVLMISVACNVEHKTSMLKHLLSLPIPRMVLYWGKYSGIMFYILMAFGLTLAFAYISVFLCGFISPKLGFGESFSHVLLIRKLLRAYLAAAAIYPIQYWLGMRLRNLTLPVAIGSALTILPIAVLMIMGITGLITNMDNFSKIITYNPYSYPYANGFNIIKSSDIILFPTLTLIFIAVSIVVLVLGALEFEKRNVS